MGYEKFSSKSMILYRVKRDAFVNVEDHVVELPEIWTGWTINGFVRS